VPHRHPRSARRLAREAVAAVRAWSRGRRHRRRAGTRRDGGRGRRPRRDALAGLCLRRVRPLRLGLGDALPRAEEHGLLDRRRLRRVRHRLRPLRRRGAGRDRSVRRRAADVRRRHDVQGRQGRRDAVVRPRRGLRRRRTGPPRDPVRRDRRRPRRGGRPDRREAGPGARARRRVHGKRRARGPVEAIQRLGGADQAIALAVSPRAFEQAYGSLPCPRRCSTGSAGRSHCGGWGVPTTSPARCGSSPRTRRRTSPARSCPSTAAWTCEMLGA
jgi:hypothetical protein